ncbi:MAG TPA: hypothetical protein VFD01_09695 [Candidatus Dormibacteraeota bacterium]|nr:hypothetical protein [Candidatus Dormibacteraeota bacterium]
MAGDGCDAGGGSESSRCQSAFEAVYDHFRLDRRGNLVSGRTLSHYDYLLRPFFEWLRDEPPEVQGFEQLAVAIVPKYRVRLVERKSERTGRRLEPATVLDAHRLLLTFLRLAAGEGTR